jgi:hypothetical protein
MRHVTLAAEKADILAMSKILDRLEGAEMTVDASGNVILITKAACSSPAITKEKASDK